MKLQSALNFSHTLLKEIVQPGDTVIDATAGKGNDTLFLAQLVGKKGHVYGFDIQAKAVELTQQLIDNNNVRKQTTVINDGHENVTKYVTEPITAAIFNLGYLPAGDHSIVTKPTTTLESVQSIMQQLKKNGVIILVVYYGHPGGEKEKERILQFAQSLDQHVYNVLQYQFINQIHEPPILLALQKR
ncbi:class I SAM-dependent methyltransferase [Fructilactobacillus sp. Tb1]|uniref:tRNA (mnm(5)s(2)U34)-methyltransferase n=1 Tax=Fructilactobacillus sp. Tb1 TaxID=3422304 RepID=UPI003D2BC66A